MKVIDRDTREIIGAHSGDRGRDRAQGLWESIPDIYRQNARFNTDFWEAYQGVFPTEGHHPLDKEMGKTNHLSDLIAPSSKGYLDWLEKCFRFPKKLKIIVWLFGILFITIIPISVTN